MTQTLFDQTGSRKYLVARERAAFVRAAVAEGGAIGSFCLTLAITDARISEVLALTVERVDFENGAIVFKTLKQRKKAVFRAVPVPRRLLNYLESVYGMVGAHFEPECKNTRLWPWGRTNAWKQVTDPRHAPGCLAMNSSLPCAAGHPLRKWLAELREQMRKRLRDRFAELRGGDGLPAGMDADSLARLVLIITWGMAVEAQSGASRRDLRRTIALVLPAWPDAEHSSD